MNAAKEILVEVRELLEKAPDASFGRGYVVQLVAELEATLGVLSSYETRRAVAELNITQLKSELEELKLQYNAEEKRANLLFDARRAAIQDAANVSYDLLQVKERAEKAEAERRNTDIQFRHVCLDNTVLRTRSMTAEAENAQLRERLDAALDKIADIEEDSNAHTSEGVCHACGICADCPQDWQPTDDHCCRVMLEMWADGEPLPWEAARRAVAAQSTSEAVSTPCPICGVHGHIGDCEGD